MYKCSMWKPENYHKALSPGLSPMEGRKKKTWHGGKFRENIGKGLRSGKSNEISEGNQCI